MARMPLTMFFTGLDIFSGVFGRNLGSVTNIFDASLRGLADFLSRMLDGMIGLSCSFVQKDRR
jgi:hypothetical protein